MTAPADPRLEAAACEVYLWINGEQTKMPPEGYIKAAARILAAADAVDPLRRNDGGRR